MIITRSHVRAGAAAFALFVGSLIHAYGQDFAALAISEENPAAGIVEATLDEALLNQEAFVMTGLVPVMVQLQEVSAVTVLEQVTAVEGRAVGLAKAKGHAKKLDADQQEIVGKLKQSTSTGKVIYRLQRAMNAVAMEVAPEDIASLAALPEVKAVMPIVEHYPEAASSNPFMKVEAFWNAIPSGLNLKGAGVKVGIIDSGVDYLHATFGTPGVPATGTTAAAAGVTDANSNGLFPNAKFPGGWDFCGNAYTGSGSPIVPDANPLDTVNGHGTAVASLIAGRGVNANGTTYTGSYNSSTNYAALKVSPGVAPDALIYPLRVFGNSGSTSLTHLAVEWAMDPNGDGDMSDRLDVLNLSLGSTNGHPDDLTARTCDAASKAGIVVVTSAGNAYNIYYITGSPSVGDGPISVAAAYNDQFYSTLQVNSPASIAKGYAMATASFGPTWPTAGITANMVIANPLRGNGNVGGTGTLLNAADCVGKIVIMERGAPAPGPGVTGASAAFVDKVKLAQNCGAVAVIITDNLPGAPAALGGTDATIVIPSARITLDDGAIIMGAINGGAVVNATGKLGGGAGADSIASYSSRGPRRGDSMLKPDMTGPAELVSAANVGTANGDRTFNGTSSAAPHVAGGMALMRQANPTWTSDELKALVMNTAIYDEFEFFAGPTPIKWSSTRVGTGRIDLLGASRSKVIAFNKDRPDLVSVSYGQVEASEKLNLVKHISVRNKGNSKATYTVSWQPSISLPGVTVELDSRKDVSVPAGATNHFPIKLKVDPTLLKNVRDPLVPATERLTASASGTAATAFATLPRHFLNEFAGHVVLTPTSGGAPAIRVPVWAAIRPASTMSAAGAAIVMDAATGSTSVPVAGTEVKTGGATPSFPTDYVSLMKGYELQYEGVANPDATGYYAGADVQYAGVTSDYRTRGNNMATTVLSFGVSMFGNWDTPNNVGVEIQVQIDNNNDNVADFTVFTRAPNDLDSSTGGFSTSNVYTTYYTRHTAPGTIGTFITTRNVNGLSPATVNTYAMNNSVISIDIDAATVRVTAAAPNFRYRVRGVWRGVLVSQTDWMPYNPMTAGIDTSGASNTEPFWYFDTNGNSVPVLWNRANFVARGSRGLLLLHLHNKAGMRAEKVPVTVLP